MTLRVLQGLLICRGSRKDNLGGTISRCPVLTATLILACDTLAGSPIINYRHLFSHHAEVGCVTYDQEASMHRHTHTCTHTHTHAHMYTRSHSRYMYMTLITGMALHEMHGRVDPNQCHVSDLLVVDLLSTLAYFMM